MRDFLIKSIAVCIKFMQLVSSYAILSPRGVGMDGECTWCRGTSFVFAYRKDMQGTAIVFRCGCPLGVSKPQKGIPQWQERLLGDFIPEYIDRPVSSSWIFDQTQKKQTESPEFQRRLNIWGRDLFKKLYLEAKKELELQEKRQIQIDLCDPVI